MSVTGMSERRLAVGEKTVLALVLIFALSARADIGSGTRGASAFNVGIVANPAKGSVVIDGLLNDWDLSGQILTGPVLLRDTVGVRTAAMWDESNLYLSFVWRDRTPMHSRINPRTKPQKGWVDDAVQLRVKVGEQPAWVTLWCYDRKVQSFDIDYFQLPEDVKGKHMTFASRPGESDIGRGIEMMTREAEDGLGFTMEVKIPWGELSFGTVKSMSAGEKFVMGVEFMFGNDAGDWPILRLADNFSRWDVQQSFFFRSPASWGEVSLAAVSTPNTRSYEPEEAEPYGVIPVRAKIPSGKEKFTLVLEDKSTGRRVRTVTGGHPVGEAKVGSEGGKDVVEVLWDGLDDAGRLVQPGTFRVHGIAMDHVGLKYLSSFYNPGEPPWDNAVGTGGWGADHSVTEFMVRAGTNVVFGSKSPEGGYGLWAVGPEGRKVWSEKRGARALAANERHVYVIGGYYNESEQLLFRLDAGTGEYVDFKGRDGKSLQCPFPLSKIPAIGSQRVMNIAVSPKDDVLALALHNGKTVLLGANGLEPRGILPTAVRHTYPFGEDSVEILFKVAWKVSRTPFAFDGRCLYYFQRAGCRLVSFDIGSRTVKAIALSSPVGEPSALALSGDMKSLYVADTGADMQIKRYDLSGRLLATYGKKGGRPRQGRYDRDGTIDMSAVAEDFRGDVWSCECTEFPRRISVWRGADGSFMREYIGNAHYCGSGTTPHDSDRTRIYADGTEFRIDLATGKCEPLQVLWNPSPKDPRVALRIPPGMHGIGPVFYSSASGKSREYMFLGDWSRGTGPIAMLMNDDGRWHPVAAIAPLGKLLARPHDDSVQAPAGEWAGLDPRDTVFWSDADGDGFVTRRECEVVPFAEEEVPLSLGWGNRPDAETLDIYANTRRRTGKWCRFRPVRFLPNGAPVYAKSGMEEMGESIGTEMPDIFPFSGRDEILRFNKMDDKMFIIATDKKGGFKWRYPDWGHGVHGSHNLPDGNPNGRIHGAIMLVGSADAGGDCGEVVAVRVNYLHDHYLTADGIYLDKVFKPETTGLLPPATVEEARSMKFEDLVGHGEPFMGWFGRHDDGKIRSIHGNFALACHVCEVTGFDTARRFESDDFVYTAEDAVNAEEFNRAVDARKNRKTPPYSFGRSAKVRGEGAELTINLSKGEEALNVSATVTGDASPWMNGGKDFTRLFKSGDCLDIQLGNGGESDQRLVFAPFGGKTVCVQMKPKDSDGKSNHVVYESPVTAIAFDCVRILPVEVKAGPGKDGKSWSVSASVPWKLLGVDASKPIRGDFGMILSDPSGMKNAARVYHFNKRTGLVSDLPNEARLMSHGWGEFN